MNFKDEKSSIVPDGWTLADMESLGAFSKGSGIKKDELQATGLPCVRYGEIYTTHEHIVKECASFISDTVAKDSKQIKAGDILFAGSGESRDEIGKAVAYLQDNVAYAGGDVVILSTGNVDLAAFLTYALETDLARWQKYRVGEGYSVVHIYKEDLCNLKILLAPPAEQRAIAHVLGLVDRAIELNNKIIAQKELRKKWLMQNLLTGKKRLKGFTGEWKETKLGQLATESAERNGRSLTSDRLMAVTKSVGIVPMREKVQGESVERCKLLKKNSFAYNPMRLNIGSIARWTSHRSAMVSGDYVVFNCIDGRLDPTYLDFFRQTKFWSNFVKRAGDGSVRVRIYFSHLKHLKYKFPTFAEQLAIANVLESSEKELDLLKLKSRMLREQKKGLMQQLLTGKMRLKTSEV